MKHAAVWKLLRSFRFGRRIARELRLWFCLTLLSLQDVGSYSRRSVGKKFCYAIRLGFVNISLLLRAIVSFVDLRFLRVFLLAVFLFFCSQGWSGRFFNFYFYAFGAFRFGFSRSLALCILEQFLSAKARHVCLLLRSFLTISYGSLFSLAVLCVVRNHFSTLPQGCYITTFVLLATIKTPMFVHLA